MENSNIALLNGVTIRKIWHNDKWFFSVIDIIEILTDTSNPSRYWQDLKRKSAKLEGQLYDKIVKFKFLAPDGRMRPTECADTEGVLRILMSVPSPKAEPFRLWLAKVGEERLEEMENPELAIERTRDLYKAKGYSEAWIETRIKSIETRRELTDEWKQRDVNDNREYAILTAEIAKATFG